MSSIEVQSLRNLVELAMDPPMSRITLLDVVPRLANLRAELSGRARDTWVNAIHIDEMLRTSASNGTGGDYDESSSDGDYTPVDVRHGVLLQVVRNLLLGDDVVTITNRITSIGWLSVAAFTHMNHNTRKRILFNYLWCFLSYVIVRDIVMDTLRDDDELVESSQVLRGFKDSCDDVEYDFEPYADLIDRIDIINYLEYSDEFD
jgi:hypothetical protein